MRPYSANVVKVWLNQCVKHCPIQAMIQVIYFLRKNFRSKVIFLSISTIYLSILSLYHIY